MQAIISAAGIRFRPILMTFLATFLDLIPMAIGMGRGSEANIPLARAVVGGLLTSTCLDVLRRADHVYAADQGRTPDSDAGH